MKNEILERAMFAMPLSKDARNSGIMAGFEEEMPDDTEDQGMEEMPPMARTPQNPEILMNTLRGDMRSLDARYQELAQMVGEEAAMETPPEVLAMLQPQLAAPQAGIGGLPQAQAMMPPGAGMPPPGMAMPPPDQMGAPQPAPAMPQGGIPMPAGMESAPPFSPGAEQAPPTPDGMPPMQAALGAFITPAMRMAQMAGNKVGQVGSAANAALGRMFMNPEKIMTQPYLENVRGAGGRFTAEQIQRGGDVSLLAPTFTQGLQQGVARVAEQYPRLASALRVSPMAGMFATLPFVQGSSDEIRTSEQEKARQDLINQIPTGGYPPAPPADDPRRAGGPIPAGASLGPQPSAPKLSLDGMATGPTTEAEQAAIDERQLAAADKAKVSTGDFIKDATKTKPLSKMERIKASQAEYAPLFEELLGSDKESAKINALLLLSEAGLKLASTTKPTFAMALADSFAGVPRGVAAIAAQERELALKTKTASLQQAISDVGAEDAAAAARQKVFLEGTMKMQLEQFRNQGYIAKDGGAGLITYETKNGSRVGESLNPAYVDALKQNPIAVLFNDPDVNPFVRDVGAARTVVQRDPKQRNLLEEDLNQITTQLNIVRDMKAVVADAYSPGTFFTGVKNEYLVPLLPNAIVRPDLNKAQVTNTLKNGFSDLIRGRASQNGRLTNMQ